MCRPPPPAPVLPKEAVVDEVLTLETDGRVVLGSRLNRELKKERAHDSLCGHERQRGPKTGALPLRPCQRGAAGTAQ